MKPEMKAFGLMTLVALLVGYKKKKRGNGREQDVSDILECNCFCSCSDGTRSTRVRIKCDATTGADCQNLGGKSCTAVDSQGNVILGTLQNCEQRYFPVRS